MTKPLLSRSVQLAALAIVGTLAGLASAQAADLAAERPSVAVRYDDLNLASDGGARRLYARLQQAAVRVCPGGHDRDRTRAARRACQAQAVDAAVLQVSSPRLAALHAHDGGRG
ncbi:MAG: UrcA family protein [Steroidobacteraceae bacterium]